MEYQKVTSWNECSRDDYGLNSKKYPEKFYAPLCTSSQGCTNKAHHIVYDDNKHQEWRCNDPKCIATLPLDVQFYLKALGAVDDGQG